MNSQIVPGGLRRVTSTPEFRAQVDALRETVRARHAAELAEAGFFRRILIRDRIAREFQREYRLLLPSPQALYVSKG